MLRVSFLNPRDYWRSWFASKSQYLEMKTQDLAKESPWWRIGEHGWTEEFAGSVIVATRSVACVDELLITGRFSSWFIGDIGEFWYQNSPSILDIGPKSWWSFKQAAYGSILGMWTTLKRWFVFFWGCEPSTKHVRSFLRANCLVPLVDDLGGENNHRKINGKGGTWKLFSQHLPWNPAKKCYDLLWSTMIYYDLLVLVQSEVVRYSTLPSCTISGWCLLTSATQQETFAKYVSDLAIITFYIPPNWLPKLTSK